MAALAVRVARGCGRGGVARRMASSVTANQQIVKYIDEEAAPENIASLTGFPEAQIAREVRITEPATKVTQSGTFQKGGAWQISWNTQQRWENPTMGWASTADPMSNLQVNFDSEAAATAFCEKMGWSFYVQYQPKKRMVRGNTMKSGAGGYGANFSWDKRCRNNTK